VVADLLSGTFQLSFSMLYETPTNAPIQGRIYARAKGVRAQGGILKKNRDWSMVCGGGGGCPRERNLREIYTENTIMFCQFFVLFLLKRNRIRTNNGVGGWAQKFLGPRGVKYLNTGLHPSFRIETRCSYVWC
jgi:hypothetical protein